MRLGHSRHGQFRHEHLKEHTHTHLTFPWPAGGAGVQVEVQMLRLSGPQAVCALWSLTALGHTQVQSISVLGVLVIHGVGCLCKLLARACAHACACVYTLAVVAGVVVAGW